MEERAKKPDKFRFTTLFGIVVAVFVIVMTASAAGQHVFSEHDYSGSENDTGLFSFLPFANDVLADDDGVTEPVIGEEAESDSTEASADREQSSESGQGAEERRGGGAEEPDGTTNGAGGVILARLATTVAEDGAGAVSESYAGAISTAEKTAESPEAPGRIRMLLDATADVWRAFFGNIWPFLKGTVSGVWSVLHAGSHYEPAG